MIYVQLNKIACIKNTKAVFKTKEKLLKCYKI